MEKTESNKYEILDEIKKSVKNEKNRKYTTQIMLIILLLIAIFVTILVFAKLLNIIKITENISKIKSVSMTKQTELKKIPIDKAGYYVTYKIEVKPENISDRVQWDLFYATVPKELRSYDVRNKKYIVSGMFEQDGAFFLRNKLENINKKY